MDTQTLVREGVRLAASSGDAKAEEKRGKASFDPAGRYYLESYQVKIEDGQAIAKAETKIEAVFWRELPPFTYQFEARAPVIQ
ncbi:hypothetical protein [Lihuaxuella thermophila]|uniref:Uncharacterized protein n=1 Tax=Lihuaxuella thermophila TaxID=1173111 RepID=A0A1H8HQN9_9BACL|nr:hypothetical protein [Lihuaxuella thermophila]SEN58600.1 hypothetical protein SAMN05444955_1153 [Lihuaxuella thermophila]